MDLFQARTVADYLFEKDTLFARLTLSDEEFKLYQSIYQSLAPQAPTPDLVIYLQASTEALIDRVQRRGLRFERNISDDYLSRLSESYGEFFHHYDDAPLLVVNSDNLNFVDNADDFDLLLDRVKGMRGRREYFSVGN
jgi:deoxyadenosine/deoxycytidine kinase